MSNELPEDDFEDLLNWKEAPSISEAESAAKTWIFEFLKPAYIKYKTGKDLKLEESRLTVEWKNKRYICSGVSRLGDVWLKNANSDNYYDHRVNIKELSNWQTPNVS